MHKEDDNETIKRMANLLRQGATLTDISCPACASPLFRLEDQTLWCEKDQKKVVVIKNEKGEKETCNQKYNKIERTLLSKVEKLQIRIEETENVDEIQKLSSALSEVLNTLEKVKKMKS